MDGLTERLARRLVTVTTIALLASALSSPVAAQAASRTARADSIFSRFSTTTPGAAAIVVREGEVVFRAGYGMADLDHGIPVTPQTVFDVASVSKQFGGFAVASLVEAGELALDWVVSGLPVMHRGLSRSVTSNQLRSLGHQLRLQLRHLCREPSILLAWQGAEMRRQENHN
ncbi:MAG TPA: class A beta-lactamase-related serine hydrolase, partial [Gemmatimonadetes bacterium]|nr:class A beta-lactamase-related serine hydrolase [Gemmatimonadota bacterium]